MALLEGLCLPSCRRAAPPPPPAKEVAPPAAPAPAVAPAAPTAAPAAAASPARRVDDKLAQLLARDPRTGKPIDDIDQLVAALPDDMRARFTFVHQSRSPAGGLGDRKQASVDPQHPRAVLFSADGRLLCAFTTDPDKPGYDVAEFVRFVDEGARFELTRFVLPAALRRDPTLKAQANDNGVVDPPECLRCHGQDPRPLLDSYPLWPGFYGSHGDSFQSGTAELAEYRRFVATARSRPALRRLTWPSGTQVPPYIDPDAYDHEASVGRAEDLSRAPNTLLSMALGELNRKRIERKLAASPRYRALRKGLLAILLDCLPPPLARSDAELVAQAVAEDNRARLERMGFVPRGPGGSFIGLREGLQIRNLAEVLYVARALDVDPRDFSLSLEDGALGLYDGMLTGMFGGRSFYLKEDLVLEMLRRLARDEPAYAGAFATWHATSPGMPFGEKLVFEPALAACGRLADEQRATGNLPPPPPGPLVVRPPAPHRTGVGSELPACAAPGGPVARCIACHEGEEAYGIGRALPLSDAALLKPLLGRRAASSERTLEAEILARMESRGPERMPPHGTPPSDGEVAEMRRYLATVRASR